MRAIQFTVQQMGRVALASRAAVNGPPHRQLQHLLDVRTFSTEPEPMSYMERKKALKDRRRRKFEEKLEIVEKRSTRRDGRIMGEKRRAFQKFFIKKKVDEEYMNRKARQAGLEWKIEVSVIMQRWMILAAELPQWRKEWFELADYLRLYTEPHHAYPKELQFDEEEKESSFTVALREHKKTFFPKWYVHPTSRETEADLSGDTRTTNRKLDQFLYLIVKDADASQWHLPTTSLKEGETLLDAGRRAMIERIGHQEMEWYSPSYQPCAVDMTALPEEERNATGFYGTKTFFMRFRHYRGTLLEPMAPLKDHSWLTTEEFCEFLKQDGRDESQVKFYHYML